MAYDFNQIETPDGFEKVTQNIIEGAYRAFQNFTDAVTYGTLSGEETAREKGYFFTDEEYYFRDPKVYLSKEALSYFNLVILEISDSNVKDQVANVSWPEDISEKPCLVFQQKFIYFSTTKVFKEQNPEATHKGWVNTFLGVGKISKHKSGKYIFTKLWNKFYFDSSKEDVNK